MNQLWREMSESHHPIPALPEISYFPDHYFSYHELFNPQMSFTNETATAGGYDGPGAVSFPTAYLSAPVSPSDFLDSPTVYPSLSPSPSTISESPRVKRSYIDHGDGYKWRKYGQKPIKGKKAIKDSKYSRSYFKCTHRDCPVKKYVQESKAGRVTQIIYKCQHNHDPPQPGRRSANESIQLMHSVDAYMIFEEDEQEEVVASAQGRNAEAVTSNETTMEPKIIVQTKSGIDHPDDGYKWRKYGQKVVNGNRNPRSYFKCTNEGCSVRKQVERCSMEPEYVSTTYDGKHNHSVPAGMK